MAPATALVITAYDDDGDNDGIGDNDLVFQIGGTVLVTSRLETLVAGQLTVELRDEDGNACAITVTDENGNYVFENVPAFADYTVVVPANGGDGDRSRRYLLS